MQRQTTPTTSTTPLHLHHPHHLHHHAIFPRQPRPSTCGPYSLPQRQGVESQPSSRGTRDCVASQSRHLKICLLQIRTEGAALWPSLSQVSAGCPHGPSHRLHISTSCTTAGSAAGSLCLDATVKITKHRTDNDCTRGGCSPHTVARTSALDAHKGSKCTLTPSFRGTGCILSLQM